MAYPDRSTFSHKKERRADTTWANLENIRLNERSWSMKTTYSLIPFTRNVPDRQIHRQEADWQLPRAGVMERYGVTPKVQDVFLRSGKCPRLTVQMEAHISGYTKIH